MTELADGYPGLDSFELSNLQVRHLPKESFVHSLRMWMEAATTENNPGSGSLQ